ncbi:MAG TPA: energy transducer TonB [Vicinamibacteria bacterium]|nr:energy transducer TonB [Vicinamibacteria bacterium]
MAYSFFDSLLDTGKGAARSKRKLTLPVSIAIHLVVIVAVLVVPLMSFNDLPEPVMNGAIRAYLVNAAPPPPPPPPPPPAAAAPRPVTKPRVEQPRPVVQEPSFTAPVETHKEVPEEQVVDSGVSGAGEPGGEPGGVPGGVAGGTEGGVIGGTLEGVPGGTPGGVVGGVIGGIPEAQPKPPPGPVRVGGQIRAPAKVRNVAPVYPPVARKAGVQGTVILEATISPQGRVTNVRVLRGIPLLDDAALEAVRQWSYSPTLLNGVPVPVVMTVTVNFRLDAQG